MRSLNLEGSPVAGKLQTLAFAMMGIGVALTAMAVVMGGMQHFYAVWTLGFSYVLGITITMMFFSGLQFLVRAGWSTSVRRISELFAGYVPADSPRFVSIVVIENAHGKDKAADGGSVAAPVFHNVMEKSLKD